MPDQLANKPIDNLIALTKMGGAAAAALLGGGAYAYHRNRKKKKNAYGEEEKEAQYKPYTSYTPPIISPYHMIKKSDDAILTPNNLPVHDSIAGNYFDAAKQEKIDFAEPKTEPIILTPGELPPNYSLLGGFNNVRNRADALLDPNGLPVTDSVFGNDSTSKPEDSQKSIQAAPAIPAAPAAPSTPAIPASPAAPPTPASPAAPEDPGAIDEDFLAQEGGPDYLKTQDPSWFEQNKWPLLGGLAAAGLLGGGAYAYHRSKQKENKKDSTEDDDEEKEAQYKPYTSYTPPIISPYKFFNYYGQSS